MRAQKAFIQLTVAALLFASAGISFADDQASASAKPEKSGAELWAQTCNRCHNSRSPTSYSDTEWEVAMAHMRTRAKLTEQEYKAILEFLKSAN